MKTVYWLLFLFALIPTFDEVRSQERKPIVAVLQVGASQRVSEALTRNLESTGQVQILDRDQASAAARGTGYSGSFNLTTTEARNLGAAIGCDFFIIVTADTLQRSPSTGPNYFESYAWIFMVSARTGRLILWQHPRFKATSTEESQRLLEAELASSTARINYLQAIRNAAEDERAQRQIIFDRVIPVIEAAPDDEASAQAEGLRLPRPYRRLVPRYPDTAAVGEIEGVVDVLVDVDAQGEITKADVARWAGFGLDEAALDTVRQLHFFPAKRDGRSIPMRILLRYNFRRPLQR